MLLSVFFYIFFFKQKTAYEMRISDWSSDVCSSDLHWKQSQKLGLDANLLLSKRWETGIGDIGFLIEGSYTDLKFLDSSRNVAQAILVRNNVPGLGTIRYPSFVNINYNTADRYRPSVATALQWRPSNELELYADFLFQGYRSNGYGSNLQINSGVRSEEHTSELQSLMRISYAVFCLKKKTHTPHPHSRISTGSK